MIRSLAALAVLGLLATPALAVQSKLDQAIAKADEQLQKGKPEDAVKTLTKAANEAGAEGQVALGRLQERVGNLDAAATAYEQARVAARTTLTGTAKADVLAAVVQFTLRRGKAADALTIAREAVAAGSTPAALAALARAQVRTQDAPAALATADKAVAAGATSALAHVARGEALLAVGRHAEAEAALRKAVDLDPKSALAQSRLALALLELKRPADALTAAKRATEIDNKFGEGFGALGLALIAADPQKNWSEAINHAQLGATTLDLENAFVHLAVGKIFEVNGQYDQAAKAYRRALEFDPAYGPARFALIQAEINRGNRDGAIAEAKRLAAEGGVSPEINRLVGEDAVRHQDYATAIPFLEKATQSLPGNADGWALLGRAYHGVGRYDDAAEAYKKTVDLLPDNTSYRATYGLILGQAGDLEGGLVQLQKVTGTPGYKDAAGWTNLGWIYRNLDKAPESIAAYQKALELDPKLVQAALGLGWAYQYTKSYDKAIEAYQKALQIDPKEATGDANFGMAWCYFFKRQVPEARAAAAKAAAAGRNVTALLSQIDKLEDAFKKNLIQSEDEVKAAERDQEEYEKRSRQLEAANRNLGSRNPATRSKACKDVAALAGSSAVSALVQLMQTDSNYDVRIACTQALGSLGAAGRPGVRNVEAMLKLPVLDFGVYPTPEQTELQMKDGDWRRALRDTLAKIR
jgi:superkiller protein 3